MTNAFRKLVPDSGKAAFPTIVRDRADVALTAARRLLTLNYRSLEFLIAPMDPTEIRTLIEQNLGNSKAEVQTDGQGHYEATVICPTFAGKRSLQRHQMVYATLGSRVGREIHALALQTFTPEEWEARAQ